MSFFRKPTPLPVQQGGTGDAYFSAGYALIGNGYSALIELTPSTSGNVMTSNGTTWTSAPPSGGGSGTVNSGTQYQLGYYATTGTAISGSSNIKTDANGNLGLGVTLSAWSGIKVLQVGSYGGFYNLSSATGVSNNFYYDGTNARYINATQASYYSQSGGIHGWYNAPSGTAGNVITFTQAMTLDTSGNLEIGATDTTGSRLSFGKQFIGNNGYANAIRVYDNGEASNSITSNSYGFGFIQNSLLSYTAGTGGDHAFFTANTERMRITSAGNLTFSTSNAGIIFNNSSALTNSTLNDYETGTWTPTDASGAGLSITANNAKYTKIGRLVYVSASTIAYPATSSGTTASLGGLPFTNTAADVGGNSIISSNAFVNKPLIVSNSNNVYFYANLSTGASTNAQLSATTFYGFSAIYQTSF